MAGAKRLSIGLGSPCPGAMLGHSRLRRPPSREGQKKRRNGKHLDRVD